MSRQKKSYVGKIGFCDNSVLGFKDKNGNYVKGGHYVYIREMNGNKCNVNVITSLENNTGYYDIKKLSKVRAGMLYAIPKDDADFSRWSAINLDGNINGIKITDIQDIGQRKIRHRHKWYVGKYHK